jgi:hypothetical protein
MISYPEKELLVAVSVDRENAVADDKTTKEIKESSRRDIFCCCIKLSFYITLEFYVCGNQSISSKIIYAAVEHVLHRSKHSPIAHLKSILPTHIPKMCPFSG